MNTCWKWTARAWYKVESPELINMYFIWWVSISCSASMSWALAGAVQWMAKPKRSSLIKFNSSSHAWQLESHALRHSWRSAEESLRAGHSYLSGATYFYNPIHNTLVIGGRYWLSRNSYPARPKEVLGPN